MTLFKVIDLFAGPGGLGEGFARASNGNNRFDVMLSVEKDPIAVRTLRLRKALRLAGRTSAAQSKYYQYVRGEKYECLDELLEVLGSIGGEARRSVLELTLGKPSHNQTVRQRIAESIKPGEPWVLVGGPPCQAYSLVGRTKLKALDHKAYLQDHRHTLYREYLHILHKHRPAIFVMENVKGMLSSRLGNRTAFEQICVDLHDPGKALRKASSGKYKIVPVARYAKSSATEIPFTGFDVNNEEFSPQDFVIRSERHGVPQARHRVILLGISDEISEACPQAALEEREAFSTVADAIGDMPKLRSRISGEVDNYETWAAVICRAAKVCSDRWGIGSKVQLEQMLSRTWVSDPGCGGQFISCNVPDARSDLESWIVDTDLGGVLNHEARSHMKSDLCRYMYFALYAAQYNRSPTLQDAQFPKELRPQHNSAHVKKERDSIPFADRFRVQRANAPATTVTSHISKDGHYFIHYDPLQCRSLTVREAARLQTFPDNYFFEGNRTQQYVQVGNAVPPYLAKQIAEIVLEILVGVVRKGRRSPAAKT